MRSCNFLSFVAYNSGILLLRSSPVPQVGEKKPKSYSGEHTPSFTELCKPRATDSLIVPATPQECTLSDYEFIYLT